MRAGKRWLARIALVGGIALLTGCGAARSGAGSTVEPATIAVVGKEFSFTPGDVSVRVGQPVALTFANEGQIDHDWAVAAIEVADGHTTGSGDAHAPADGHDDGHAAASADAHTHAAEMPDVHISAPAGTSGELYFTPTRAGAYEISCTIPGHKEAGMHGTLTVTQ